MPTRSPPWGGYRSSVNTRRSPMVSPGFRDRSDPAERRPPGSGRYVAPCGRRRARSFPPTLCRRYPWPTTQTQSSSSRPSSLDRSNHAGCRIDAKRCLVSQPGQLVAQQYLDLSVGERYELVAPLVVSRPTVGSSLAPPLPPAERISNPNLKVRTIPQTKLDLSKQAALMGGTDKDVEASLRVGHIVSMKEIKCRASSHKQPPAPCLREVIRELDIERDQREIVADPNFHVWTEAQLIHQWCSFDMPAKVELVRVNRGSCPYPHRLRDSRSCEKSPYEERSPEPDESFHENLRE